MYEVKKSRIHGLGLFATQVIPADTLIGELEGSDVTEDGAHVLWITEERGVLVQNDMKYINHAGKPNAAYYDDLTVMSLREIQPGEEITHDYDGGEDGGEDGEEDGEEEGEEDGGENGGRDLVADDGDASAAWEACDHPESATSAATAGA